MNNVAEFAALVLKHDDKAVNEVVNHLFAEAANEEWYAAQDRDEAWIEEMAMMEDYRHCRMPGE
jgi:hypothetical protein